MGIGNYQKFFIVDHNPTKISQGMESWKLLLYLLPPATYIGNLFSKKRIITPYFEWIIWNETRCIFNILWTIIRKIFIVKYELRPLSPTAQKICFLT